MLPMIYGALATARWRTSVATHQHVAIRHQSTGDAINNEVYSLRIWSHYGLVIRTRKSRERCALNTGKQNWIIARTQVYFINSIYYSTPGRFFVRCYLCNNSHDDVCCDHQLTFYWASASRVRRVHSVHLIFIPLRNTPVYANRHN